MVETAAEAPILGEHEFARLLQAAAHSAWPCRDRAILHLFWHFGATVRQVICLEVGHVNFLTGRLQWPDGREWVLPAEALHALTAYVSLERDPRCARLFAGRHGRPLSSAQIARMFERLSADSGIAADPLRLRRAALYRLLRADPLRALCARRGPRAPAAQSQPQPPAQAAGATLAARP